MPFPSTYKLAMLKKSKTSTIRVGDEINKYMVDKTYTAHSYQGDNWKIKIKIINIFTTPIKNLTNFGIPKKSIESLIKKTKLKNKDFVELINFKYI